MQTDAVCDDFSKGSQRNARHQLVLLVGVHVEDAALALAAWAQYPSILSNPEQSLPHLCYPRLQCVIITINKDSGIMLYKHCFLNMLSWLLTVLTGADPRN